MTYEKRIDAAQAKMQAMHLCAYCLLETFPQPPEIVNNVDGCALLSKDINRIYGFFEV